ncbi:MAG: phosphotransferase [Anaerolineales bacterium]|nr:phosphotransferase [Anaerolineales bacterium]
MTNPTQALQLKAIISIHYDLGELVDYEQLNLGYVNVSYIITTKPDREAYEKRVCAGSGSPCAHPFFGIIRSLVGQLRYIIEIKSNGKNKKYFLRRYKQGIKEEKITFEHSVINHLTKENFRLVARVIPTRDGKTYIKRSESGGNVFYAIFDFLTGDDRYTWVDPNCSDEDLKAAAAVLARFHNAVFGFIPKGRRYEAKIIDLLPGIAQTVEGCAQKAGKTVFDAYFVKNINLIQETIQRIQRVMEKDEYKELIQLVIHCDYHPGNLKFQNGEITGLFDFDWSKVDVRCFDVALAMTYFCVAWEGKQDGDLQLNKVALFLDAYQNILRDTPDVGLLGDVELKFLPYLIGASNIYVLNWSIGDFYSTEVNPHEYLTYLQHGIRFLRWLENQDNWGQLKRTVCA